MKTTKKQFNEFKKECQKWIKTFGLLGWRFYFEHADEERGNACAYITFPEHPEGRVFTIGLPVNIDMELADIDIMRSAFHEVMEALLYKIRFLAKARYVQPEEIDEEIHNLVRTLESAVYCK